MKFDRKIVPFCEKIVCWLLIFLFSFPSLGKMKLALISIEKVYKIIGPVTDCFQRSITARRLSPFFVENLSVVEFIDRFVNFDCKSSSIYAIRV